MGRRPASALTEAELALMEVLWRKKRARVADVLEALPAPRPGYNSIQTRLNILTEKGYANRETDGRAYVYRPALDRERVVSSAVKDLVSRFFKRSSALALRVISDEALTNEELAEIESAIARKARKK